MSTPPFAVSLVILDVDGTLVDFVGAVRTALAAVAEEVSDLAGGREVSVDRLQEIRNEVASDPQWRGRSLGEVRHKSFRRVLAAFGVNEPAPVEEVRDLYYRVRDDAMVVFPDVEDGLRGLRRRGLPLVAASNGNLSLASVGLDGYFSATHYAEEVGIAKPDPGFFALAVGRAGGSPQTTLAVGDRLDNDYEPARAAGLHAVLIDRKRRVEDGSVVRVGALTELVELLEPL